MENLFKAWRSSRKLHLNFFDQYNLEQLNKTPDGFSNNLIWNIGHVIVAQQSLIYRSCNLPLYIPDRLVELYKPGTRPVEPVTADDAQVLKELMISLIEKTETDFYNRKFEGTSFNVRTTATGFHLGSLQDAFEFNNYHEGIHLGYMMCIRKFV